MTIAPKDNAVSYLTLSNGLRVVHVRRPAAAVGYCGLAVRAGSRDEDLQQGQAGLAHFVEHTIFKGTQKRRAWHILNRMEAVGGELNAFTTKEDTVVYTVFPRGNTARALELVADLVTHSTFPASELEKERDVVCDEIDSYLDSPADAVYDDFEDLIFHGTPLGHNILGTKDTVQNFHSADCRGWLDRYYTAARCVLFYAGAEGPETLLKRAEQYFSALPDGALPQSQPVAFDKNVYDRHRTVDTHQAHTVCGLALPPLSRPDRTAVAMLSNILGGPGMNSLLNLELRERRGLVYNVETSTSFLTGCGQFAIYYGCDPADARRCRRLVGDTIARVADGYITERRLAAARKQYLGGMLVANENAENRAIAIARATLMYGRALTPAEIISDINAVTPEAIRSAASLVSALSTLTLGPAK